MFYIFILLILLGSTMVFYSFSPYYAAFGLMLSSVFGCMILGFCGFSFLAMVLLLIYVGGMLVVFVYSSALSAERFPVVSNLVEVFFLFLLISFWVWIIFDSFLYSGLSFGGFISFEDLSVLSVLYDGGGFYLLVGGLALLVVLVVALVVSYSFSLISLRAL
uniref:NADH-ubiquinone oxidoreductase chain 6 n=1 Tax=Neocucumis proteus TaxID=2576476 RepID=A0A8F6D8P0_9ECHN|nr:NADH dehydrogenase subunit 6 [Neocucumis proteus]